VRSRNRPTMSQRSIKRRSWSRRQRRDARHDIRLLLCGETKGQHRRIQPADKPFRSRLIFIWSCGDLQKRLGASCVVFWVLVQHQRRHRAGASTFHPSWSLGPIQAIDCSRPDSGPPSHWLSTLSRRSCMTASGRSGRLDAARRRPERGVGAASIRS
jgi:hypothetical protein